MKLNPWIVEGENEARAVIRPAEIPAEKGRTTGQPCLSLRVLRAGHGEAGAAMLSAFDWESGQGSPPRAWRETVRVGGAFGRWLWESAPRIPVGTMDRQAIAAVLNRLRDALLTADRPAIAELLQIRNAELARALDLEVKEVESDMMAFFEPFLAAPERRLDPVYCSSTCRRRAGWSACPRWRARHPSEAPGETPYSRFLLLLLAMAASGGSSVE